MLIIRSHVGNNGSIIASGDTDLLQHGRGTYSYVWPRDGALIASALWRVGSYNTVKRFFEFCNDVITDEGVVVLSCPFRDAASQFNSRRLLVLGASLSHHRQPAL